LLAGQCTLLVAEGADAPRNPQLFLLRPGKVYNVKKGVWHQHVLAPGTSVLVVENRNTTPKNSPKYFFGGG
jgi:ureidoglycolate hydrolase